MNLVFLLEEPSAREMLKGLLPRLLCPNANPHYIVFEGKQDQKRSIERRLRGWLKPDSAFIVIRDQDSSDCRQVKHSLAAKCCECRATGRSRESRLPGTGKLVFRRSSCRRAGAESEQPQPRPPATPAKIPRPRHDSETRRGIGESHRQCLPEGFRIAGHRSGVVADRKHIPQFPHADRQLAETRGTSLLRAGKGLIRTDPGVPDKASPSAVSCAVPPACAAARWRRRVALRRGRSPFPPPLRRARARLPGAL